VVPPVGAPDPGQVRDRYTNLVASALFPPLAGPPDAQGRPTSGLARAIEVEGRIVTIRLDPRFRWDEAHPVTAGDVARAWERKLGGPTASDLFWVENARCRAEKRCPEAPLGLTVQDEATLRVTADHPVPAIARLLSLANFAAVPAFLDQATLDKSEWWREWSYGPYRVTAWDAGGFRLEARAGAQLPLASPRWRGVVSRDGEFSLALFRKGEADWVAGPLPPGQVRQLRAEFGAALYAEPTLCLFGFWTRGLAPGLRQRLDCALDRDAVTLQFLGGGQQPAFRPLPPDFGRASRDEREAACAALEPSRPRDPLPTLRLLCNPEGGSDAVCSFLAEGARQRGGPDFTQSVVEWKTMLEVWRQGQHDLMRYSLCGTEDPQTFEEALQPGHAEHLGDDFLPVYQQSQLFLVRPGTTGLSPDSMGVHPLHLVKPSP
jgi:ABC-type transport system substrate-binding protein